MFAKQTESLNNEFCSSCFVLNFLNHCFTHCRRIIRGFKSLYRVRFIKDSKIYKLGVQGKYIKYSQYFLFIPDIYFIVLDCPEISSTCSERAIFIYKSLNLEQKYCVSQGSLSHHALLHASMFRVECFVTNVAN